MANHWQENDFIRLLFPVFSVLYPHWCAEVSHYHVNGREQYTVDILRNTIPTTGCNRRWVIYDSVGVPFPASHDELVLTAIDLLSHYGSEIGHEDLS